MAPIGEFKEERNKLEGDEKMKILISFYSHQGHTRKMAEKLSKMLNADLEEIIDLKDRSKLISWFASYLDEELVSPTKIKKSEKDVSKYDLVIVGTPLWDGVVPAVKEYLSIHRGKFRKVAFFSTFGANPDNAFFEMGKIIGKKPVAVLELQDRQINLGEDEERLKIFCKEIKSS